MSITLTYINFLKQNCEMILFIVHPISNTKNLETTQVISDQRPIALSRVRSDKEVASDVPRGNICLLFIVPNHVDSI